MGSGDIRFFLSPGATDLVAIERLVSAQDRHIQFQCLRNQEPIEWVSMVQWERSRAGGMTDRDRKLLEPFFIDVNAELTHPGHSIYFSQVRLDRQFPRARRRNQHNIAGIRNDGSSAF
jgi:hypothetical protein